MNKKTDMRQPCSQPNACTPQREDMSFGELVKSLRIAQKKTLRQFCLEHGHDPSNWSKIERGINRPPYDDKILERWARQLGLKPGTEVWQDFMDKAAIARGELPKSVLSDEDLFKKLPVFFRTVQGSELGKKELEDLIRKIKEAHTPDEY
jgi:transcriptional regulator with XRE-family HTH domain